MKIRLRIEPSPPKVTHQQHKIVVVDGKPKVYDGPALSKARSLFVQLLGSQAPDAPFFEAVSLKVCWRFPVPSRGKPGWKPTRPDTDNLEKLLKDCLTKAGYWTDDALVVQETVEKVQVNEWHGVSIEIDEVGEWKENGEG